MLQAVAERDFCCGTPPRPPSPSSSRPSSSSPRASPRSHRTCPRRLAAQPAAGSAALAPAPADVAPMSAHQATRCTRCAASSISQPCPSASEPRWRSTCATSSRCRYGPSDPRTHPDATGDYDPWRRPGPKRDFILSLGFALQRANVRMLRGSSLRRRRNRAKDCFASGSRSQ